MLAACFVTITLSISENARRRNRSRKNTKLVFNTKPNNSPIAPMEPGKIAAMRIITDKDSQKRKSVRATCPWIRDRSRKRRTQSQQSEEETQSLLSRGERIIDMTNLTKRLLLNKLINPPAQLRDAHRVTELSIQEQYNHVEEHEVCRAFKSQK